MSINDDLGLNADESDRLKELKDALESEFLDNEAEGSTSKSALSDIEDLKSDFLQALRHTVRHSQSDALKAKVAMWGYDKLLDQGKASVDPIRELIEGMEGARATVKQKD
jgi:CHASE3 domain sensor protein